MFTRLAVTTLVCLSAPARAGDPCKERGFDGLAANTESCVNTPDGNRTITCKPGYVALAPDLRFVTIGPDSKFAGCKKLDHCSAYGFSGHSEHAQSCQDTPTGRVVTCTAGFFPYAVNGKAPTEAEMKKTSIELAGNAPFLGCRQGPVAAAPMPMPARGFDKRAAKADACARFGFSGKEANATGCKPIDGGRIVSCRPGFVPVGNPNAYSASSVTLMGDAAFAGCRMLSMCQIAGFSGNQKNAISCVDAPNTRTIRCAPSFFPAGSNTDSITLAGEARFDGCRAKPL